MERAIFELDAIRFAATQKVDGILVDERHVPQIQNQRLPGCLEGEQLLKLLDILCCFDPTAECEQGRGLDPSLRSNPRRTDYRPI